MRASYVSLIILGFVMGAAAILLADSGTDNSAARVAPVAATGGAVDERLPHAHNGGVSLTGNTACEAAGAPISDGQTSGTHGHRGPSGWTTIDRATRNEMTAQLAIAHQVTVDYPTVAAAEAAGYRMTTTYVPCIGAHYLNAGHIGGFDPAHPAMLLYDGTDPDAKIVGLSYAALSGKKAPEGFAGSERCLAPAQPQRWSLHEGRSRRRCGEHDEGRVRRTRWHEGGARLALDEPRVGGRRLAVVVGDLQR